MKNTAENRKMIAQMVHEVSKANNDKVMDRGSALKMLISNLEHEERENKLMLYDNGGLTPDEIAQAKAYWKEIPKNERDSEYGEIMKILEKLKW